MVVLIIIILIFLLLILYYYKDKLISRNNNKNIISEPLIEEKGNKETKITTAEVLFDRLKDFGEVEHRFYDGKINRYIRMYFYYYFKKDTKYEKIFCCFSFKLVDLNHSISPYFHNFEEENIISGFSIINNDFKEFEDFYKKTSLFVKKRVDKYI